MNNYMNLRFKSCPENELLARSAIISFITFLNPTFEELTDVKTSVSEAVTNSIIHGYENCSGIVELSAVIEGDLLTIKIADNGSGISDIEKAKEPLYTTKPEMERSGMGFTIMESFMDTMEVISGKGKGTCVIMTKKIKSEKKVHEKRESVRM